MSTFDSLSVAMPILAHSCSKFILCELKFQICITLEMFLMIVMGPECLFNVVLPFSIQKHNTDTTRNCRSVIY